jgi:GntR family transcriptional regulator/MocR family aminotransferase
MFDILLSNQEAQPLYMQLYWQIRKYLREGVIPHGSKLPSVRALQLQLNISKTPIETAYGMLISEGYVQSKQRSGLYIITPQQKSASYLEKEGVNNLLSMSQVLIPVPISMNSIIDFNPTGVDKTMFPFQTWKKMLNVVLDRFEGGICRYGDLQGESSFRAIIADYLKNARGVVCSPEQIIVGSGIAYSMGILTKLLKGNLRVAFEEPGFEPVREQFLYAGFQVIPILVQDKGLLIEKLDISKAQIVYVTPSHQFPTGSVMPYVERENLLNWANLRNAFIIEDDYDGEFRYQGKPIPSLQSLDLHGRVIYIGTFSKAFTPALRMNYMVLPMELITKLQSMHHLLNSPSFIDQMAMQLFMEQGHWYRHIRKMRKTYRMKHDFLIELLKIHLGDLVEITGHNAGLHIQITVKTQKTSGELVKLAADHGVIIHDFHHMWMNRERGLTEYPVIYLGFGGIYEKDIEPGILLLRKAWCSISE